VQFDPQTVASDARDLAVVDVGAVAEPVAVADGSGPRLRGRSRKKQTGVGVALEWILIIGLAISVALLVRATVVQTFFIPTVSMTPTLAVHDRLLVDKVTLRTREIERGDIIVFRRPKNFTDTKIKDLIKRVIALPGETVEGRDGKVFIDGKALAEPYLPKNLKTVPFPPIRVPVDNYFMMGDNRPESFDSRYWGPIEREDVVGRALVRIWPPNRLGGI
jgi:signal peptidase I